MSMTMTHTIETFEEKLKGDIEQLRDQLAYARRTPERMSAFYGFTFITSNRLDAQTVEILFSYENATLLRVLLHNKMVSFHKFGLECYTLSEKETMQLFDRVTPELQALAFFL